MKKVILLSSVMLSLCASAQICFSFEDSTTGGWLFNLPDRWHADSVSPLNGSFSLHHAWDNDEASADAAVFSISGLCPDSSEVRWDFTIRHGTDPSSSNKWAFLLMSDAGAETIASDGDYNGFAVGVNISGYDDTLRLWHLSEGKINSVITTRINWQTDVGVEKAVRIRVKRQPGGIWTIEAWSLEQGETGIWYGEWGGISKELLIPRFAGIFYSYTSTRDRLLWLDDVCLSGIIIPDTLPPSVLSVTALTPDILQVICDEELNESFSEVGNFRMNTENSVSSVIKLNRFIYELHLTGNMENRKQIALTIDSLCDLSGNCSISRTVTFVPIYAITGDVVISEIMADPSPPVGLPESEYLEITNLTSDSINTREWLLIADRDTSVFPQRWIKAGERVILCPAARQSEFAEYGEVYGLKPFPVLNDSGETIALRDGCGALIHAVSFTPSFYNDVLRSGGGWAAELTDIENPFNEPDAWRASLDPAGGTPGRENSVAIKTYDNKCPEIIAAWPVTTEMIRIMFDETVIAYKSAVWSEGGDETLPALSGDIADRTLLIPLRNHLSSGVISRIEIPVSVTDFAGNSVCTTELKTGLPTTPAYGEILFNELLPDPDAGCQDYLELYNNSQKIFSLSELLLADGSNAPAIFISAVPRLLFPEDYIALTTDRLALLSYYRCSDRSAVYETSSLPAMPDERGSLVLYDRSMNIIDRVDYSSSMHLLFLSGREGIALEKVAPQLPSGVKGNWHSASESCGWGTPGAENSTLLYPSAKETGMNLSSSRVSPDGDGFEDILSVDVYPGGEDNIITVTIFNDRGFAVRRLAERFSAGIGAQFVWDGTSDNGARLPAGLYMIITESFNSSGDTRRWKEPCAVLYR
jgi:hypothetical protein